MSLSPGAVTRLVGWGTYGRRELDHRVSQRE